eukprot:987364-Pyramimonas_sp.AAC.1
MLARPTRASDPRGIVRRGSCPIPSTRAKAFELVRHAAREACLAECDEHVGKPWFPKESARPRAQGCFDN